MPETVSSPLSLNDAWFDRSVDPRSDGGTQRCKYAPDEDSSRQCTVVATWHLYVGNPWDSDHRQTRVCDEHHATARDKLNVVDEHPIDADCSVPVRAWRFPTITEFGYCMPGDEWTGYDAPAS